MPYFLPSCSKSYYLSLLPTNYRVATKYGIHSPTHIYAWIAVLTWNIYLMFSSLFLLSLATGNIASLNETTRKRMITEPNCVCAIENYMFEEHELIRRAAVQCWTNLCLSPLQVKRCEGDNDKVSDMETGLYLMRNDEIFIGISRIIFKVNLKVAFFVPYHL